MKTDFYLEGQRVSFFDLPIVPTGTDLVIEIHNGLAYGAVPERVAVLREAANSH